MCVLEEDATLCDELREEGKERWNNGSHGVNEEERGRRKMG